MKAGRVLVVLYGITLGGLALWAWSDPKSFGRSTRSARKKAEKTTGVRLPRPDILVESPVSEEDFELVDDMICQSAMEVDLALPDLLVADPKTYVDAVTLRTLQNLLPDFPWPSETGDHPSAAELQGLIRYEVTRSLTEGTLCLPDADEAAEDSDDDLLEEDFIPSPEG